MADSSRWNILQEHLADQLGPDEFATWFKPLRVRSEAPERLVLEAPNPRFVHTLEKSYRPAVDRAIAGFEGPAFEVLFSAQGADDGGPRGPSGPRGAAGRDHGRDHGKDEGRDDGRQPSPSEPAAPEASRASTRQGDDPGPRPDDGPAPQAATTSAGPPFGFQLNPRYTFETFVVGSSNQFAHAAARAVAESPSHSYNPLFLYGGVGLGKTHLLHAIAHHIHRHHSRLQVLYLAAEQFVNELINSIRFDRMPAFRERYRTIDILLVDDIQFLANKERTQEEFFHTFNTLYTSQKQIILSSDSSPRDIPTLEERLRSRFEWGLITDIQSPDLETKVAILRRKADSERLDLPQEVALFIARQVRSNIRELEGLLNRVLAFASLTGRPLSMELAKETLKDILPQTDNRGSASDIIKFVAKHYGLKVSEIKSRNKSKQIVFPRQVAMYLCKRLTELSYPEIGKAFNGMHHSTVMHGVDMIEKLRAGDDDLDRTIRNIVEHFS